MASFKKEVTGSGEKLKAVKNAKNAPKTAKGGGTSNQVLKASEGYVNQGPVTTGDTSFAKKFTKTGARGAIRGKVSPAKETVTNGMGGKFIRKMK